MSESRAAVDDLLASARARLRRVEPEQASAALSRGAVLIDIRSEVQRAADGVVPGALFFPRNVLEWRCDPTSAHRDPRVGGVEREVILMCDEGYQSSLAAAALQDIGFARATDLIGGFQAWRSAGMPAQPLDDE